MQNDNARERRDNQQPHAYTRRTILRAAIGAPFVLGAMALLPEEADAAQRKIVNGKRPFCVTLYVPSTWKALRLDIPGDATEGWFACNTLRYRTSKCDGPSVLSYYFDIVAGPDGKPTIKRVGPLEWKLTKGKRKVVVSAGNTPLQIWDWAHGNSGFSLTKAKAKQLLKISTGGKIKYETLVKWSRAKAKTRGEKAVRAWVGSKVVKKIRFKSK